MRFLTVLVAVFLAAGCASPSHLPTTGGPGATGSTEAELRAWLARDPFAGVDWRAYAQTILAGDTPQLVGSPLTALERAFADLTLTRADRDFLNTAFQAYLWGYGPMTVYRLQREKTNSLAPLNAFFHATHLARWQLPSPVSAPDMDVLYSSAFLDLGPGPIQFHIPPLEGYYVVQLDDAYGNSNASLGARTQPGSAGGNYTLVGPSDPGYQNPAAYPGTTVIPSDTRFAWLIVRVPLDPYSPVAGAPNDYSASPAYSANTQFTLTPLTPTPSPAAFNQVIANRYASAPRSGAEFFRWLGEAVAASPLPTQPAFRNSVLPAILMNSPSYADPEGNQQFAIFASFSKIGLDSQGFHPQTLTERQLILLEVAFAGGQQALAGAQQSFAESGSGQQPYWHVTGTSAIGKYPNTWSGWFVRSEAGFEGGIASLAVDGTYPLTNQDGTGTRLEPGAGYQLTFPPGGLPPIDEPGFWSLTVYSDQAASGSNVNLPGVSQAGVNNVFYSPAATLAAEAVDSVHLQTPEATYVDNDTIYFAPGGTLSTVAPNTPYYVVNASDNRFQLSATWSPDAGQMQALVLDPPIGTALSARVIPVHSLGSQQLGQGLEFEADGSLVIYLQSTAPSNGKLGNWLPLPTVGQTQVMMRLYHPTPANRPVSVLSSSTIPLTTTDPVLAAGSQAVTPENRDGTYVVPPLVRRSN